MNPRTLFILLLLLSSSGYSLWAQSEAGLEDIIWDEDQQAYFITDARTGDIYKESKDGLRLPWSNAAMGTHGLAIDGRLLFSAAGSTIYCYEKRTGRSLGTVEISGASFINGLVVDMQGHLYASDFNSKVVYLVSYASSPFKVEGVQSFITLDEMPSAIAYDPMQSQLVVSTWGRDGALLRYSAHDAKLLSKQVTDLDNISALAISTSGDLYAGAWGKVSLLKYTVGKADATAVLLEGTDRLRAISLNSAGDLRLLSDSQIASWNVKDVEEANQTAHVFPNPVSINAMISFELEERSQVDIRIYDCQGRVVKNLGNANRASGTHRLMFDRDDMRSGLYFVQINSESKKETLAVTLVD